MAVIELVQEKTVTSEAERARRVGAPKAAATKARHQSLRRRRRGCGQAEPEYRRGRDHRGLLRLRTTTPSCKPRAEAAEP